MYLKSLELQGFKSFPDKTKLQFERGTTVIVGPNGSGKSNISDAMRWVLGEISSKSLRGSKMEDIIFGGADSRRPMGFAEVSVTFDNTDEENKLDYPGDEVTVTRRYYRAGESEYYINRRACRLRDIYELFMNTGVGRDGYSIIGQGKIAEIISRKSDERRSIFEDASGIAKYRHRKNETERKLKSTEENMTRVTDVFREVEAQVLPLEKEAERAKKAIELHETKKKVDVQLWLFDSERLRVDIEKAEENFRNSTYDLRLAEEAIADYNAQSDRLFEESQANTAAAEEVLERIRALEKENYERDSQYSAAGARIAGTRERIEQAERSVRDKTQAWQAEAAEGERRRAELSVLAGERDRLEAAHTAKAEEAQNLANSALTLASEIATALADVSLRENEVADITVRRKVLENNKVSDSDKNQTMEAEIGEYRKISETLQAQLRAKEEAAEGYRAEIDAAGAAVAKLDAEVKQLEGEVRLLADEETDLKAQSDIARQRVDAFRAMEEHFEGYSNSVRFVMDAYANGKITDKNGRKCGKIYGPLSTVISVEKKYVTAIETALAANLQHIVVEDEEVAKAAMFALKRAEAGRATFFPLTSMRALTPTAEMEEAKHCRGYVGVASDLVGSEDKFRDVVSSQLGRTVVFEDLDSANEMARRTKFRVKVVTLDGQVINAGGSFTGGSLRQRAGVLSRAGQIEELSEKLKTLAARLEELAATKAELEDKLKDLMLERDDVANRAALLTALQGSELSEAAQYRAKWEANEELIEKLHADFEALNLQRAGYDDELLRLAEEEKALRCQIEEIGALRAEKDVARNELLDRKSAVEQEMTELYIKISAVRKDIETVEIYIADSDARAAAVKAEIEALQASIVAAQESIDAEMARQEANRNTFAEGERVLNELNERRQKLTTGNMDIERKRAVVSEKLRDKMAQQQTIFQAHTKNENKLNSLREEQDKIAAKFWEDYEMTRNDALALGFEPLTAADRAAAVELQVSCRNRLRAIGNVDLDAVNKYKEVKERYDYMSAQIADMTAARDDLLKIINDLEGEMKTSFVATFNQINENFNRTFSELFGGGHAEIALSDPSDVLTSGIEIKAAPPGKIIKNLTMLSGGEQSFVAIALFFAILQVNPTPFFILDEIEAALDEVNVARFAAYIKRYSLDTQFILITHRRGTMEAAQRLYGVTMPERGISKVLALDVASIAGKQEGDDWNGIFS
ncbi:MAG: chromosome segregation protein SMC [Clostridia bacterium]|nr:chromosome segregation protein SMC [Clostridia bacterium]